MTLHTMACQGKAVTRDLEAAEVKYDLPLVEPVAITRVPQVEDQEKLERELATVHAAIQSGLPVDEHPGLAVGQRARVVKGPLIGIEGFVIEEARRSCLVLHVETLGRGAGVEIERDLLEPIED